MKWIIRFFIFIVITGLLVFFLYFNNLSLADRQTVSFYKELKEVIKKKGYKPRLLVISTKRFSFHNKIQVKYAGAATKSRHLTGDAIDFLVFDINNDGKRNAADVDIVYKILDEEIMKNKGGIGTYKNEKTFIDRQMVHIDCREVRSRWAK
jgi:uncharacterized protein YcbK (DUF882 family)